MIDSLRDAFGWWMAVGFGGLLVLLRLEAEGFGAAEFDESTEGRTPPLLRRLAFYAVGLALLLAVLFVHPDAEGELHLGLGDRLAALTLGLAYGSLGVAQAVGYALWRYRRVRLPDVFAYPGAILNDVGTAFLDEAAFRGVVLGLMLPIVVSIGRDPMLAVIIQALLYVLVTRAAARGRPAYGLYLTLGIGVLGGWLTVQTGGIGAAFLGHAVTRFAVFVCTGHPGAVPRGGAEIEEIERSRRPPDGWRAVGNRS